MLAPMAGRRDPPLSVFFLVLLGIFFLLFSVPLDNPIGGVIQVWPVEPFDSQTVFKGNRNSIDLTLIVKKNNYQLEKLYIHTCEYLIIAHVKSIFYDPFREIKYN